MRGCSSFFFFNDTATTEIYTLSLHDALPIWANGLDFLVQIVHDLRSPLTSILFLAETLMQERSGPVNERQQRQLGLIYSAAFGLSSLTSDTIELARGGDQLADDRPTPLSVSELLESVCDIVRPIAAEIGRAHV